MARNTSVMGIYPDRTTVSDAINVLLKKGYRTTDISFLSSDNQGTKDFLHESRTKALEGAATGAVIGAIVGAAIAWFLSVQTVSVTVSFVNQLVLAGPVVAALAGAAALGTLGWMVGALAGFGMKEYVAKRYAGRTRRGGIPLSVHCDTPEWCDRAKRTLKDTGARSVSSAVESGADFGSSDKPFERAPVPVITRTEAVHAEPVRMEPVRTETVRTESVQTTPDVVIQDTRR